MRLKENNQLKLISLLIAILLFLSVNEKIKNFSVIGNTDSTTTAWVTDIPVEADYNKEKLYILGIPNTVSVKLRGAPSKVQKESVAKNFKVKLNLKDVQIGDDQKVKLEVEGLDKSIEGSADPSTITVSVREKTTKEFAVIPTLKKERLTMGYEVEKLKVNDESVKISGDLETINSIREVRAESDNKTKINKNTKEEAKLVAYDGNYNRIEDIQIEPESTVLTVEVKNIEKEVPVTINTIGTLPEGYELVSITPEATKATVRGESQIELDKLTEMLVDVDLSDVKDEIEERSNLKLYPKEDIRVTSDPAIVKVTIKVRKK